MQKSSTVDSALATTLQSHRLNMQLASEGNLAHTPAHLMLSRLQVHHQPFLTRLVQSSGYVSVGLDNKTGSWCVCWSVSLLP